MQDISLLQTEPERFFGLSDGYDRRDLKRAYGKAIRIYKPESHPSEFTLVRQAYERLEQALRYGRQQRQAAQAADHWEDAASRISSDQHGQDARASAASWSVGQPGFGVQPANDSAEQPKSMTPQQMALVDPAGALVALEAKVRLSPQDYYLKAVLADATARRPTSKYLEHLLDGLDVFPNDPGLIRLATEFLSTEVSASHAPKMVLYVAKKLRQPLFYQLTERLWRRVLESQRFPETAELLKQCEQHIVQRDLATRDAFQLQFLKWAIWQAPIEYTESVIAQIESNHDALDYYSHSELDLIVTIQALLKSHEYTASQDGPLDVEDARGQILAALRMVCLDNQGDGVAQALQTLASLAAQPTVIQRAFPVAGEENDHMAWFTVCYQLVNQLQVYLDEPEPVSEQNVQQRLQRLYYDLLSGYDRINRAANKMAWWLNAIPVLVLICACFLPFALRRMGFEPTINGNKALVPGAITLSIMLINIVALLWIFPTYLAPRAARKKFQVLLDAYSSTWRPRLFRYARSCTQPWEVEMPRMENYFTQYHDQLPKTVASFTQRDFGLAIFVHLQTLLR